MEHTRPKPIFADYFIYDNDDTVESNFFRYCEAQPRWRNDCEQWRHENAPPCPAEVDAPFPVDAPRLGWYDTYLKGLFLDRAGAVYVIASCILFYIFWW